MHRLSRPMLLTFMLLTGIMHGRRRSSIVASPADSHEQDVATIEGSFSPILAAKASLWTRHFRLEIRLASHDLCVADSV